MASFIKPDMEATKFVAEELALYLRYNAGRIKRLHPEDNYRMYIDVAEYVAYENKVFHVALYDTECEIFTTTYDGMLYGILVGQQLGVTHIIKKRTFIGTSLMYVSVPIAVLRPMKVKKSQSLTVYNLFNVGALSLKTTILVESKYNYTMLRYIGHTFKKDPRGIEREFSQIFDIPQ